jgi:hypothetical protein
MPDDPAKTAIQLRAGAKRLKSAASALDGRASELPRSMQRRLLKLQANILREGADTVADRALEIDPAKGEA